MNSKEIITNDEIMKEAKRWLASFTNEELSRKIDEVEEKFIAELEEIRSFEWLKSKDLGKDSIKNNLQNIECTFKTKKDEREFNWSLSKMPINLQTIYKIVFKDVNGAA